MAGQPTTRLQVSGHRFLTRRIERALLHGDARHPLAPARPWLAVGGLLAAVAVAGCALLAFVRPQPALNGAPIVLGRPSGALYVRVGDTLHPVLNLASARLIAATAADPRPVRDIDLEAAPRGPLLGIPGAPPLLGAALSGAESFAVCDTAGQTAPSTTVVVGNGPAGPDGAVPMDEAVLVGAGAEAADYLLYRGRRMVVDRDALRPAGLVPRRVSELLLTAVPEAPAPPLADAPARVTVPAAGTLCVAWTPPDSITVWAGAGLPLPAGQVPAALAQADGAGPALDAVALPSGRSAYVRSGGARYLVADTGVRFAIGDDDAARNLGLPATPVPAPWPVLAGLPAGPQLNRPDALLARDVIGGRP